ncbi:transglutaminase domain-containing protein [Haloarchaeobius sp. DFWS5]|uniref:transglutaminase domain-containing protein n=1 Tax=Haloarchaeobius sp. DFWS5 TaxID=3446114 RepID=UPI003EC0C415
MTTDKSTSSGDDGRALGQTALALVGVVGLVLAAMLLPGLAGQAPFADLGSSADTPTGGELAETGTAATGSDGERGTPRQNGDQPLDTATPTISGAPDSQEGRTVTGDGAGGTSGQPGDSSDSGSSGGTGDASDGSGAGSEGGAGSGSSDVLTNGADAGAAAAAASAQSQTIDAATAGISELGSPPSSTQLGGVDASSLTNQSAARLFTVWSSEPTYFRTNVYQQYTGTGWDRTSTAQVFTGEIPDDDTVAGGGTIEQRIRLEVDSGQIPTAWRPTEFTVESGDTVVVSEQATFRREQPLPKGTVVTVTSQKPPNDPTRLNAAGMDYPADIEATYTQLPAVTPERVRVFASSITDDDQTAYQKASAIENWLETHRAYSLQASHDQSRPVVDQFLFEMETGYCQHFASAMVVMLRSEGIPARYVTGYSPGVQLGANEYALTTANAHAWVEVYFPGTGWVQFDPTPAGGRQTADQTAFSQAAAQNGGSTGAGGAGDGGGTSGDTSGSGSESAGDDGSGDDNPQTGSDGADSGTSDGQGDATTNGSSTGDGGLGGVGNQTVAPSQASSPGSPGEQSLSTSGPPYTVQFNRSVVPGADVTVTVSRAGTPVKGATVAFEGERVGQTDERGQVVATVPYVRDLDVTVTAPSGTDSTTMATLVQDGSILPTDAATPYSIQVRPAATTPGNNTSESRTYRVESNVTITVDGRPFPGGKLNVTATVQDVPMREATVSLDGTKVATTDRQGRATVTFPNTVNGTLPLTVERGEISGTANVTVQEVDVSVSPAFGINIPGAPATVHVTADGDPLSGVPVTVGGERVGVTGTDGTVDTALPLTDSVTVTATVAGRSVTTTVGGLFGNLALVVGGFLAVLLAVAAIARHYGVTPGAARNRVRALVSWAATTAVSVVFAVAGRLHALGRWLLGLGPAALGRLRLVPGRLWQWLTALAHRLDPRRLFAWLRAGLLGLFGDDEGATSNGTGSRQTVASASSTPTSAAHRSLRDLWAEFIGVVRPPSVRTKTPGEIAQYAIDHGFPAGPVRVVTDAFRDAEYGAHPTDESVLGRVRSAVAELGGTDGRATETEPSAEESDATTKATGSSHAPSGGDD